MIPVKRGAASERDQNSAKRIGSAISGRIHPKPVPDWAQADPHWQQYYGKPRRNLKYVERFHYVYAAGLACPGWVPEWCGLIEAEFVTRGGRVYVKLTEERRATTARKAPKPEARHRQAFYDAAYYRFWRGVKGLSVVDAEPALDPTERRAAPAGEQG